MPLSSLALEASPAAYDVLERVARRLAQRVSTVRVGAGKVAREVRRRTDRPASVTATATTPALTATA